MTPQLSTLVNQIQKLDHTAKEELYNLLRLWLIEERRNEIARNAKQALEDLKAGKCKSGTLDDLMEDLYAEN